MGKLCASPSSLRDADKKSTRSGRRRALGRPDGPVGSTPSDGDDVERPVEETGSVPALLASSAANAADTTRGGFWRINPIQRPIDRWGVSETRGAGAGLAVDSCRARTEALSAVGAASLEVRAVANMVTCE